MSYKKVYDQKHLTTTQRIKIQKGLMDSASFASIAGISGISLTTDSEITLCLQWLSQGKAL